MENCEITERIFKFFDPRCIHSIIHYGNREGRDVDVLIILRGNYDYHIIEDAPLDIIGVGMNRFEEFFRHYNPIVTEPLLTGKIIHGDSLIFQKFFLSEFTHNFDNRIIGYLIDNALKIKKFGDNFLKEQKLPEAIKNLCFAISFIYFAHHYRSSSCVITFEELLQKYKDSLLIEIYNYFKSRNEYNNQEINLFYHKFDALIMQLSSIFH